MTELNKGEKETLELRAPCAAGGVGAVGFLLVPLGASGLFRLLSGSGHFMADFCKEKAGMQSGMVSLLKVIFNTRLFGNQFSVL